MGRIGDAFAKAASEGRAALVVYLCAGDPDLATTLRLVEAIAAAGADVIELGMPFSDPTADGPAIQRASERALSRGAKLDDVLGVVRDARQHKIATAIMLFGYYNPILAYGESSLARAARTAGVDGMLVVDLPVEECESLRGPLTMCGLDFVPLLAPTSTKWRAELAASAASAFVYYVSLTGVTGAAAPDLVAAALRAKELSYEISRPIALGFGIKTPADVASVAPHVDGVVVGSAVVQEIEAAKTPDEAVQRASALVRALRAATQRIVT